MGLLLKSNPAQVLAIRTKEKCYNQNNRKEPYRVNQSIDSVRAENTLNQEAEACGPAIGGETRKRDAPAFKQLSSDRTSRFSGVNQQTREYLRRPSGRSERPQTTGQSSR